MLKRISPANKETVAETQFPVLSLTQTFSGNGSQRGRGSTKEGIKIETTRIDNDVVHVTEQEIQFLWGNALLKILIVNVKHFKWGFLHCNYRLLICVIHSQAINEVKKYNGCVSNFRK